MLSSLAERLTKFFRLTNFKFISLLFYHIFRYRVIVIIVYNVLILHGTAVSPYSENWNSTFCVILVTQLFLTLVWVEKAVRKSDVTVSRCSTKQVFLKILQNLLENASAGVSFQYSCRASCQVFFCEFFETCKKTFFCCTFQVTTSGRCSVKQVFFPFPNFTGKHLCQSHKSQSNNCELWTFNFIKKRLQHQYFPVNFGKLVL